MTNKTLIFFSILFQLIAFNLYGNEQFSFDVTEIEILDGGNKIIGKKRGVINSNDGITIEADEFEFDKIKNILTEYQINMKKIDNAKDALSKIYEKKDIEKEIQKLISIQKINETLNYIEFPGVDSLKYGRRGGDILGDIHIPHVYYFTSYVFENLMNRYGFEKIYLDKSIVSTHIYFKSF